MLQINILLKKKGVKIKNKGLSQLESCFISISEPIEEIRKNLESDFYIEGAISIKQGNTELIGLKEWGLIDQTLSYFLSALCEITFEKQSEVEFLFPDQPLKINLKSKEGYIILMTEKNKITVSLMPFVSEITEQSLLFFEKLNLSLNTQRYNEEIMMIKKLRDFYQLN
ncbi:hypothetical protein WAF17_01105 [Bernardetia sp. ABR2-2B]|uniref:hypothetical protein n=1 Tax=Bernardetia sp. ABR2-2B TaxID=3127472 RepID=UPI0030CF4117